MSRLIHFTAYCVLASCHVPHARTALDWAAIGAYLALSVLVLIDDERRRRGR